MDLDKIEKLDELRQKGMISDEEYQQAKAKILNNRDSAPVPLGLDNKNYSMLLHFSQLAGYAFFVGGWLIPLVLWLIKRDDPYIDQQGRVVFNWIISVFLYSVVCIMLTVVIIGFFLGFVLAVVSIVLVVLGAIRAKDGVIQNYPLAIPFFAVDTSVKAEA